MSKGVDWKEHLLSLNKNDDKHLLGISFEPDSEEYSKSFYIYMAGDTTEVYPKNEFQLRLLERIAIKDGLPQTEKGEWMLKGLAVKVLEEMENEN